MTKDDSNALLSYSVMQSTSQAAIAERSSTKKNKTQSQREYRSKEIDGFSELREALLLVDPFDTPLGRDATRHQLLITAARKLRTLSSENQKLLLRLSAPTSVGMTEPENITSCGIPAANMGGSRMDWSPEWFEAQNLLLSTVDPASQLGDCENTIPGWSHSQPPFHGQAHQPYEMLSGAPYQAPSPADMRRYH